MDWERERDGAGNTWCLCGGVLTCLREGCSRQSGEASSPVIKDQAPCSNPAVASPRRQSPRGAEVDSCPALQAPGFRPDASREVTGCQRHAWLACPCPRHSHPLSYPVPAPEEAHHSAQG